MCVLLFLLEILKYYKLILSARLLVYYLLFLTWAIAECSQCLLAGGQPGCNKKHNVEMHIFKFQ